MPRRPRNRRPRNAGPPRHTGRAATERGGPHLERALQRATLAELSKNLEFVLPFGSCKFLNAEEATRLWETIASEGIAGRIVFDEGNETLSLIVLNPETQRPAGGISLKVLRRPDKADLKFCKDFLRVFNSDVALARLVPTTNELWVTLQQTRFARAIGRFSPFSTSHFMRWLRVVEGASSLRYEGHPFTAYILMTKQMEWIESSRSLSFVKFPIAIRFEQAILQEKWIRGLLRDPLIGLVGYARTGDIVGAVTFRETSASGVAFAPHSDLVPISSAIVPGTMAFVSSSHGDLYALFSNGAAFVKSQGRWRYFNYSPLSELIAQLVPYDVAIGLLRVVLDLSFEQKGGLIAILEDDKAITKIVPDHSLESRPNHPLRSFAGELQITQADHRTIIRSGAAIDGAIVLSKSGRVLDTACIIGEPDLADCKMAGKHELKRFAGARTTAAWNASIYGVAVKISEDGPITVFKHGDIVMQLG